LFDCVGSPRVSQDHNPLLLLFQDAQDVRIPSIKTILENNYRLIGLPQSLFYLNETLKEVDVISIKQNVALGLGLAKPGRFPWDPVDTSALDTAKGLKLAKSKVVLMWREKESYKEALQLYPFVSNMVVPDMAFQLGPYAPIRNHPEKMVDIIVFLRDDLESQVYSMRHYMEIMKLLPTPGLTFKIVDWSSRLTMFDTTDYFFTDSSIELLSLGKVVVCDRLHAAILSYLSGIPFVYIDQVSGKITKTLLAAFDNISVCLDKKRSQWARATTLEEALVKASAMITP
jgi:exopolysaccharide biosynthesis predicted pyruvyltransferase EpsI